MRAASPAVGAVLSLLAGAFAAPSAFAADPPTITLDKYGDPSNAKLYSYDTSVPTAPALALVENAPELSLTSPYGPDVARNIVVTSDKPGASFAARPYWALGLGRGQTLGSYRDTLGYGMRIVARSTFSAAAAPREVEKVKGLGAGLGLHTEFLDRADPRFNTAHLSCLSDAAFEFAHLRDTAEAAFDKDPAALEAGKAYARALVPSATAAINAASSLEGVELALHNDDVAGARFSHWRSTHFEQSVDVQSGPFKKDRDNCFKRGALAAENWQSFQLGAGTSWSSPDFDVSKLKSEGASVWAAYRLPLGVFAACGDESVKEVSYDADDPTHPLCLSPSGNVTGFAHYVSSDEVKVGGADQTAATTQAGLVLSRKSRSNTWSLAASAVWNQRDYKAAGLKTDNFERYALSVSFKVVSNIWVNASFGQTSGISTAKDESFGLVELTWK